jgi:hypothetical protein
MGVETRTNLTFQNYRAQTVTAIPGLLTWAFFGSMGSGNNGNQAPGGPALVQYGAPTLSANYITLGRLGTLATIQTPTFTGGVLNPPVLLTGGNNYSFSARITYSGGGGSGASDQTVVSGGAVTGFINHNGGTSYTSAPTPNGPYGNPDVIDTALSRAAYLFTPGWTIATVCRAYASGVPATVFGDSYAVGQIGFPMGVLMQASSNNTLKASMFTGSDININLPSVATQWRFVAHTYSGGAAGTENLYSLSDGMAGTPYTGSGAQASSAQLTLGATPQSGSLNTIDIAFAMVCAGPLSQSALTPIYNSVKSILATRGLTVL